MMDNDSDKWLTVDDCSARRLEVLEVEYVRGMGTEDDMVRRVRRYYTLEGELLAEVDPLQSPQPGHRIRRYS